MHDLVETPEYLLFILNVEQQKCHDIVHTLNVSYFVIVISVCNKHIEQLIVSALKIFIPEAQLSHSPLDILLDFITSFIIRELTQL